MVRCLQHSFLLEQGSGLRGGVRGARAQPPRIPQRKLIAVAASSVTEHAPPKNRPGEKKGRLLCMLLKLAFLAYLELLAL